MISLFFHFIHFKSLISFKESLIFDLSFNNLFFIVLKTTCYYYDIIIKWCYFNGTCVFFLKNTELEFFINLLKIVCLQFLFQCASHGFRGFTY